MSFDSELIRMRAEAQREYADGYFRDFLGFHGSDYWPSIFADIEQALMGTPYKVIVTGNSRIAFEHVSGHIVTSNPLSVRKPPAVMAERCQPVSRVQRMDYNPAYRAALGDRT